ncbi:MAG: glutathione S-transferase family protein [Deltaproteobacteria bacterium]|nr:glutathione S-transferase family protein [Deltaproteobacteria bacterium]
MSTSLTYFNFDASRGLECRLALTIAGVPFEDVRLKREQWPETKLTMPYGALPVLEIDGKKLAQSTAILRYLGSQHGMHPADAWTASQHDSLMQSVEDLRHKMPGGRGMPDEEKKEKREAFSAGWLTRWAATIDDQLQGPYLEGETLHVADLKLYTVLRAFMTDNYDHIPATFFDPWPSIRTFYEAVDAHEGVRAWLDR